MHDFLEYAQDAVSNLTVEDVTLLKIAMLSFGIIVGSTCPNTARKLRPVLLVLWLGIAGYLFYKVISENYEITIDYK
ncbi:MAG: hypothetical protein ATN36_03395 [Epulopiscium sp. Nele67-Bin005]|nr:MAG: hypothetical protein ATN36_03395 [Epulopiscium sp. Nele67-Bin005]